MTLSGTESGVEALSDSELQLYESYTTRAWATVLPPTAVGLAATTSGTEGIVPGAGFGLSQDGDWH